MVYARASLLVVLSEQNKRGAQRALKLMERPHFPATLRLAVVVMHFLLAGVVWLLVSGSALSPLSLPLALGVFLLTAAAVLVLEFFLERWILRCAEEWATRLSLVAQGIDFFLRPLSWLLTALQGAPTSLKRDLGSVTDDELRSWVEVEQIEGSLEHGERKMIYSIFQFGDTLSREIMVPRIDVFALEVNASLPDAVQAVLLSGHSRMPVYEDSIDNVIGLLYAKDLLRVNLEGEENFSIRNMLRPAYFVPEAKKVDELLREMQARGVHMAVVVDEYGGMAGLVTLEDIVEEIVGDIRDEYDQSEELLFQQVNPQEYIFQGRIDLDDFNEIVGTHLTKEVADTLGGFLYGEIGRVPVEGEAVTVEGWTLTVEQVSGRRIRLVRAQRLPDEVQLEENADGAGR